MLRRIVIIAIFGLQLICAFFFVGDIIGSILGLPIAPIDWQVHELIELGAGLGLILGVIVAGYLLRQSMKRTAVAEDKLRLASGAFADLMEEKFKEWELTPAEWDVALFSIKGLSVAEIAALRETSEGTVKAQTNAIYRKAGVSGRPQLLSLFIEDLLDDKIHPLPEEEAPKRIA